jgi:hypothetical protein
MREKIPYMLFVGNPKGNGILCRPRHRWGDNVPVDLGEAGRAWYGWIGKR